MSLFRQLTLTGIVLLSLTSLTQASDSSATYQIKRSTPLFQLLRKGTKFEVAHFTQLKGEVYRAKMESPGGPKTVLIKNPYYGPYKDSATPNGCWIQPDTLNEDSVVLTVLHEDLKSKVRDMDLNPGTLYRLLEETSSPQGFTLELQNYSRGPNPPRIYIHCMNVGTKLSVDTFEKLISRIFSLEVM